MHRMISLAFFFLGSGLGALGVERTIAVEAPASATPGAAVNLVLSARTDAGAGERIGLFQADYSLDDGQTWTGLCYIDNIGPATRQERTLTAGAAGTTLRVRLRVAFRDGLAGDVDYTGAAIRWNAGWADWTEPPAKSVSVAVK